MTLPSTLRTHAAEVARLLAPHRGLVAVIAGVQMVTAIGFGVLDPLVLKWLIDSLTAGDARSFGLLIGASLLVSTTIRGLGFASTLLSRRLSNAVCGRLVGESFGAFASAPGAKGAGRDDGYVLSRIYDEPSKVSDVASLVVNGAKNLTLALGSLAVCVWLSLPLTLVLVVVAPALMAVARKYGGRISRETVRLQEDEAALRGGLGRVVRSYKTWTLFDLHAPVRSTVGGLLTRFLGAVYDRTRHAAALSLSSSVLLSLAEVSVLIGAGIQVIAGDLTIGGLFAFTAAFWRAVSSTRSVVELIPAAATLGGQLDRILDFTRPAEAGGVAPRPEVGVAVRFDATSFAYGDQVVVRDLSLELVAGEHVLLSGPNGSGKSTVGNAIARFVEPSEGVVHSLERGRISALLLPFEFAPGTLRDHLRYDALSPSARVRVDGLAHELAVFQHLDRDPDSLSQGEQRRAQVLLTLSRDADLYVFDEPLSNVDVDGKQTLMDVILGHTAGRTLLVIMHGDEAFAARFDRRIEMHPLHAGDGSSMSPPVPAIAGA